MTGPGEAVEGAEVGDHLGPERVEVQVADEFQEIRLRFHHDGFVPVLEQVAHPLVAAIEGPGVPREQGPHAAREGPLPGPDQEVRMIGQEGPGINRPGAVLHQGGQARREVGPVPVVAEERSPLNPAHHDVVEGPGGIEAWLARHDGGILA